MPPHWAITEANELGRADPGEHLPLGADLVSLTGFLGLALSAAFASRLFFLTSVLAGLVLVIAANL